MTCNKGYWIGNPLQIETEEDFYPGTNEILTIGRDISNAAHLSRLGLHWEILPVGHRSCYPHAEEKEEEFVLLISGKVDAWVDGSLISMCPGEIAVFPAGTGISHCFINNYEQDAVLFVGGERKVKGNRRYYPLNKEMKEVIMESRWWDSCPTKKLGQHNALPEEMSKINMDLEEKDKF